MRLYFIAFVLLSLGAKAQTCDCLQDFNFVRQHMEKNHPGFNSDIKDPNQPAYRAFVGSLEKKISADVNGKYCIAYLKQYLLYLKDHHININGSGVIVREDSLPAVEAFLRSPAFTSNERISIDSAQLKHAEIYSTPDGTYTIALIKSPNERRDYAGVILNSKTKLWEKGQVKLEVKQLNDSVLQVYSYLRNHSLNYDEVRGPDLPGWQKIENKPESLSSGIFSFKLLDSNTAYISIRSFSGGYSTYLDSAYKAVMPELKKRRNLIIDVRGNGGGSDMNYRALMPLIYTDPIIGDVVDYYATPDNIKAYEQLRDLYKSKPEIYGANGYQNWDYGVARMRSVAPNTFVPMSGNMPSTTKYSVNKGYPRKVAIIYDRNCASSCEAFLFEARNSKKVVTVGQNSGGYTGYGNVMSITTPCGNTLSWTTTRYRNQRQYDFVGIPPQHKVPEQENNWVRYTQQLLK